MPDVVLALAIDGLYYRPLGGGRYILGRGHPKEYFDIDPYKLKESADEAFITEVSTRLENRVPSLSGARLIDAYASLYDVTPDWHPFIGCLLYTSPSPRD